MRKLQIRLIIAFVILGLAATLSARLLYQTQMATGQNKAESLPMALGDWHGRSVAVEDYVKLILETDDIIQRNYYAPAYGEAHVQLAVVFSPDNRRVAHPPEVCYTGAGWESQDKRIIYPEDCVPLVRLVLDKGPARDMVLYCYKSGKDITANYYRQQINIIANQLFKRSTSSALIRFSSPIRNTADETEAMLMDFIRQMMPEIEKTLVD